MPENRLGSARVSDVIVSLAVLALCLYIAIASLSLGPDSRTLPIMIAFFLGAVALSHAIVVACRLIRRTMSNKPKVAGGVNLMAKKNVFPLIAAAICLLYVFSIEPIGFEISSFIFLFLIMMLVEPTVTKTKLAAAVVAPTVLYLVFAFGLQLRLPLLLTRLLN